MLCIPHLTVSNNPPPPPPAHTYPPAGGEINLLRGNNMKTLTHFHGSLFIVHCRTNDKYCTASRKRKNELL
jgi:hypothetical protein